MEFDELLQQVHLSELDVRCVVVLRINERLDMSEEMLGVISDPADDTLCTPGMQWDYVSRTVFRSWMLPLKGVEITLIDHAHQLLTYPTFLIIQTNS